VNVAHWFARSGRAHGERPALAWGREVWCDHRSLCRRAARMAASLRRRFALKAGDRVALFAPNHPCYLETLLACWWAGLAAVPVNHRLHPDELAWILEDAEAALLFLGEEAESVAGRVPSCVRELVVFDGPAYRRLWEEGEEEDIREVAADHLAWLFYTSGTTGRPKGAMITHGNLRAMTYAYFIDVDGIAREDAILHAAPMSHGSGLYILPHAAVGALQIVPQSGRFDPEEVLALLDHWRGVTLFLAPTMVNRLVRAARPRPRPASGLKTIVYGGAPMYLADLDAAHQVFGFRLAQIYGQGESPMTITALDKRAHADTDHPRWRTRLSSAGLPQLVCEVRVVDAEGRPLPVEAPGEVVVRGASVVPGYWRNEAASRQAFRDGWLFTGDIGFFDADGFLYLRDRSKDLIISGGANIYPREVEEVLLAHPRVREAAVVGVPDREWGERVVAWVVAEGAVSPEELDALCLERIARYKRPRAYRFVQALPKNAYGKILKRELRRRWSSEEGADPAGNSAPQAPRGRS